MQRGGSQLLRFSTSTVGPGVPATVNHSMNGAVRTNSASHQAAQLPACCLLRRAMEGRSQGGLTTCLMMQVASPSNASPCLLQSRHIASATRSPSSRLSIPFIHLSSASSSRRFLRVKTPSSSASAASSPSPAVDGEPTRESSTASSQEHHHQACHTHQHHHQHLQGCGSSKYGSHPKCWSCDNFVHGIQLFCTTCQKVQPPSHYDFFELLGMYVHVRPSVRQVDPNQKVAAGPRNLRWTEASWRNTTGRCSASSILITSTLPPR